MKLRSLKIRNFKGIRSLDLDFCSPHTGQPRPLTCILGDNGAGKTTVLQAIALPLALATWRIRSFEEFEWPGFLPERIGSLGPTSLELELQVSNSALSLTSAAGNIWRNLPENRPLAGGDSKLNQVWSTSEAVRFSVRIEGRKLVVVPGSAAMNLAGRRIIQDLARIDASWQQRLSEVGSVFWFDQARTLDTAARSISELRGQPGSGSGRPALTALRELLVGWWAYHGSAEPDDPSDQVAELERRFKQLFPETSFSGVKPKSGLDRVRGASDFYFRIQRGELSYDIEEMASGEQVVFGLFLEFVLQRIYNSIVLIDEIELHLHPPEQQALLRGLQRSDFANQYIITTHSPYLEQVIPDEHEIRLERGNLCL